MPRLMCISTS